MFIHVHIIYYVIPYYYINYYSIIDWWIMNEDNVKLTIKTMSSSWLSELQLLIFFHMIYSYIT
jgi:hypothetical protein